MRGGKDVILNCTFDSMRYKSKPASADMGAQNNRLVAQPSGAMGIGEFLQNVGDGRAYISGHIVDASKGRHLENLTGINFISLDVDNKIGAGDSVTYTSYTRQDAIDLVAGLLDAKPLGGYTTFSGQTPNGAEKFRLIYGLEGDASAEDVKTLLTHILDHSDGIFDTACKEPHKIYQGTCRETWTYDDHKAIKLSSIADIADAERKAQEAERLERERRRQERQAYAGSSYVDFENAIEELKGIDLGDYLQRMGYSPKPTKSGYKMPCPIHNGKKDNFHVDFKNGAWLWTCRSRDCGGGTIIDLHCELEGVGVSQAIKELCEMHNIEIARPVEAIASAPSASNVYKIDKYISQDQKATRGILEAIEQNQRILITGAMGCGKTHFVTNDIYRYSQGLEKKLVVAIPGVNQINNLHHNMGIMPVRSGRPYDGVADRVVVTPESLVKVTDEIGEGNYILVVDESHERYTSLYRDGYSLKNVERAEQTAHKVIHMTATPRPLLMETFDETISLETSSPIKPEVKIITIPSKKQADNLYSIVKKTMSAGGKVVLFNNNKKENQTIADKIGDKRKQLVVEYIEAFYNPFDADAKLVEFEKDIETVKTETVHSGKESQSIIKGRIDADITCATSVILAGIDLYTDGDATLVVKCSGALVDNLLQLLGRFRNGIKVILVVPEAEEKEPYELAAKVKSSTIGAQRVAELMNSDANAREYFEDGFIKDGHLYQSDGKWLVDETMIVASAYEKWSSMILSKPERLKELLESQNALDVGVVTIEQYSDENESAMSESAKLDRAQKKQLIEDATSVLLGLEDSELSEVLDRKNYAVLDEDARELVRDYFDIAETHVKKLRHIEAHLFSSEEKPRVKAFRELYSGKPYAQIEREIMARRARAINRFIKKNGLSLYMDKRMDAFKRSIDVRQARIRYELREVEQKRGVISKKVKADLICKLVRGKYIYDKDTKVLLDANANDEAKKKAFQKATDLVEDLLKDIYNFDTQGKIQSPKC